MNITIRKAHIRSVRIDCSATGERCVVAARQLDMIQRKIIIMRDIDDCRSQVVRTEMSPACLLRERTIPPAAQCERALRRN